MDVTDRQRWLTLTVGWGAGILTAVSVASAWYGAYAVALLSIGHPLFVALSEVRCYLHTGSDQSATEGNPNQ